MASSSGIQVCVRVRPTDSQQSIPWKWTSNTMTLPPAASDLTDSGKTKAGAPTPANGMEFRFGKVFHPEQSTISCYQDVCRPLVRSFLEGYDACLFAYGQTGSGKTHTICGNDAMLYSAEPIETSVEGQELGFLPLVVQDVFQFIQDQEDLLPHDAPPRRCVLKGAFVELYNENLRDLLTPEAPQLAIAEDALHGVHMPNLESRIVSSLGEVMAMVREGQGRRVVGVNSVHEHSSRSHTIFQLTFESRSSHGAGSGKIVQSVFNIVDLAGSETNYVTPTDHQEVLAARALLGDLANIRRLEENKKQVNKKNVEGSNIRKSLLALIRCVDALAQQQQHQHHQPVESPLSTSSSPASASRRSSVVTPSAEGSVTPVAKKKNVGFGSAAPAVEAPTSSTSSFVPFRDSKLTRLLRSAVSGNSHAAILCTVNPTEVKETMGTLRFASKAQTIHKAPRSIVVVDSRGTVLNKLEEELERLREEMALASLSSSKLVALEKNKTHSLEDEKLRAQQQAAFLQQRCANLERLFLQGKQATQLDEEKRDRTMSIQSRRSPSAPASTRSLHDAVAIRNSQHAALYVDRLRAVNDEAILATQDELVKEMLSSQRKKIDFLSSEVERLKLINEAGKTDEELRLKRRVQQLEGENRKLTDRSEDYRLRAITLAGLYEIERETLETGIPSGVCGGSVKVRRAPRLSMADLLERHPELKSEK